MKTLNLALIFMMIFLSSCNQDKSEFSPNNLISVADDFTAEQELAKSTGAPYIDTFTLSSNKTYTVGDIITITTTMSKRTIVEGTPRIPLNIGGDTKYANYISGSESTNFKLVWQYTIQAGDLDHDGISIVSPYELNNGNVKDYADKTGVLTFTAPDSSGMIVDTANLSFDINGGSNYANNTAVTINLSASNVTEVYIGSSCLGGGSWSAYGASKAYTLPSTNATNNVYVSVRNASGGRTACETASIVHDNQNPNAPSGVIVANNGSDIASDYTSWSSISDNGPSGINHYEYAVSTTNNIAGIIAGGSWVNIGTNTTYQIDSGISLTGGTTYYTLLKSIDNAGNESTVTASTGWTIIVSPEQITSMNVVDRSTDFIKVGWPYPDDNGTAVTDYIIQYKLSTDSTWTTINDGVSTSRRYKLTGLTDETSYDFRVRAFNGINYGAWSPSLTSETLPNLVFFQPGYKAINIGGATTNQLVSFDDNNNIYKDGNTTPIATLNKGDVLPITATDFTVIEADKAFFIAGRLGSGSNTTKANVVWATNAWVGKEFLVSHSRTNPMKIKVFAFTDSDIEIFKGAASVVTQTVTADNGYIFTISSYGSYKIVSTGFIVAYAYANGGGGTNYVDPKPLLPASTDIIGVPSSSGKLSSSADGNPYTVYYSNNTSSSGTSNQGSTSSISGTGSVYSGRSTRVRATNPIVANSYADANGNCSAPYVPTAFQKKRFGLNVVPQWSAFVSSNPAVITVTQPGGSTSTITLTRTGSNNNTPYKGYSTTSYPAGTLFESSEAFQMWYEPKTDTYGANDDETVMFGWDT